MAAAVAGLGKGGGGNDDAWSYFLEISIFATSIFLLLYFLLDVILDLKIWSVVLPPIVLCGLRFQSMEISRNFSIPSSLI